MAAAVVAAAVAAAMAMSFGRSAAFTPHVFINSNSDVTLVNADNFVNFENAASALLSENILINVYKTNNALPVTYYTHTVKHSA